jgi:hypothetical protein
MSFHRDDDAYWLEDLVSADETVPHSVKKLGHRAVHAMGPD